MSSQKPNTSNSSSSNRSTYRRCEIRSVIRLLILRNESAASLHRQLVETYGSEVMTHQHVTKWVRLFKEGRTHTHDEEGIQNLIFREKDHGICFLGPERDKKRVKLTRGVSLLHDNARPHRPSHSGPAFFIWVGYCDSPALLPELGTIGLSSFNKLKEFLGGQRFSNDEKVQDAVENWLREVERKNLK
ncbi:hypothetical protein QTP88_004035 [Uroleucon formosanum]